MQRFITAACLILFTLAQPCMAQDQDILNVKLLVDRQLTHDEYIYKALNLALSNQELPYKIEIETIKTSQPRRREIVSTSPQNYVIALGSRLEHELKLQAVYVPIHLGIGIGQRVILTREDVEAKLKSVKNIKDLSKFTIGQGLGWTDVNILQDAGLKVVALPNPTLIPNMILHKRLDLYPRGLFEIELEYARYAPDNPGLVIDQYLLLSYPLASFFYTRKGNDKLHRAIKNGLERAYRTGKLNDLILVDPIFSKTFENIQIKKRVRINIPSSIVSDNTSEAMKKFKFFPDKPIGKPVQQQKP